MDFDPLIHENNNHLSLDRTHQIALQQVQNQWDPKSVTVHGKKERSIDFILNPVDKTVLTDHKGQPVTVDRMLSTKPLKAELSTRPGPGNRKLLYLSGDSVTRTLNDIFGFDGWNLDIRRVEKVNAVQDSQQRWHVAYQAAVRLTLSKSHSYREDYGAGDSIDKSLATACAHALKASITDALKRAARHFGDKLGNSLYESQFSMNAAPATLQQALDWADAARAKTKFGAVVSTAGANANVAGASGVPASNNNNDNNKSVGGGGVTAVTTTTNSSHVSTAYSSRPTVSSVLSSSNNNTSNTGSNSYRPSVAPQVARNGPMLSAQTPSHSALTAPPSAGPRLSHGNATSMVTPMSATMSRGPTPSSTVAMAYNHQQRQGGGSTVAASGNPPPTPHQGLQHMFPGDLHTGMFATTARPTTSAGRHSLNGTSTGTVGAAAAGVGMNSHNKRPAAATEHAGAAKKPHVNPYYQSI